MDSQSPPASRKSRDARGHFQSIDRRVLVGASAMALAGRQCSAEPMVPRSRQAAISVLEQDADPDPRVVAVWRIGIRMDRILLARTDAPRRVAARAVLHQQHRSYAPAPQS